MNVNIISSNNNYGLTADMKLITYTLKKKYNKKKFNFVFVEYVQYRCDYAAINIFIEKINYELIKYGGINIFIPNHEFFNKNWIEYLDYMDIVLVKSLYSREVFNSLTDRTKVKYIGWRSTDRYLHTVSKDYSKILHLSCSSTYKHTQEIVDLWKPEFPELTIIYTNKLVTKTQSNIKYINKYLSDDELNIIFNSIGVHLCVSEIESYGHSIQEGKLAESIIITVDSGSMSELIDKEYGFLVNSRKVKLKNGLGSKYIVDSDDLENTINKIKNLDIDDLHEMGKLARKSALQSHVKHETLLKEIFDNIFKSNIKIGKDIDMDTYTTDMLPNISICTPTYNKKHMFKLALFNYSYTTYPKDKIEWIIVDDGDEKITDLLPPVNKRYEYNIKYYPIESKLNLGEKRNFCVDRASNDIILFMDDDDYYLPNSIKYRVINLLESGKKCVGCTTMGCFHLNKLCSIIYVPPHILPLSKRISEATLSFYKSFWEDNKFKDTDITSEGHHFVDGRLNEFGILDWEPVIVSLLHSKNTSNKIPVPNEPNGCHYGWNEELYLFLTNLDVEY